MYLRTVLAKRQLIKYVSVFTFAWICSFVICLGIVKVDDDTKSQITQLKEYERKLFHLEKELKYMRSKLEKTGEDQYKVLKKNESLPYIFVITPTYTRPVQKAELTRLAQTFLHVPSLHWIVVEDRFNRSKLVTDFLAKTGLSYTHLYKETLSEDKLQESDPNWLKPRGVQQRNEALSWIRTSAVKVSSSGVVYFADDDNTYDLNLFREMRYTKAVSVWPVGLVGKLLYEAPLCSNGKVTGWRTYWKPNRAFAMDMAGFAVNLDLILKKPSVVFARRVLRGELESEFLSQLVTIEKLEPRAGNCTKILVWHTRTEKADLRNEEKLKNLGVLLPDTNIEV